MSCLRSKLPFTASEKGSGERKGELKKTYQLFYPTFLKTEIYTLPNELIKPEIQNAYTSSTQSGNRDTRGGRSHHSQDTRERAAVCRKAADRHQAKETLWRPCDNKKNSLQLIQAVFLTRKPVRLLPASVFRFTWLFSGPPPRGGS